MWLITNAFFQGKLLIRLLLIRLAEHWDCVKSNICLLEEKKRWLVICILKDSSIPSWWWDYTLHNVRERSLPSTLKSSGVYTDALGSVFGQTTWTWLNYHVMLVWGVLCISTWGCRNHDIMLKKKEHQLSQKASSIYTNRKKKPASFLCLFISFVPWTSVRHWHFSLSICICSDPYGQHGI